MGQVGDILFDVFWIVTGVTANIIALTLSFFIFACIWRYIITHKDKED